MFIYSYVVLFECVTKFVKTRKIILIVLHIDYFTAVVILCFMLTVSTAFEYQLTTKQIYMHRNTGEKCTEMNSTIVPNQMSTPLSSNRTLVTEANALRAITLTNSTEEPIRLLTANVAATAIESTKNDGIENQNDIDANGTTTNTIQNVTTLNKKMDNQNDVKLCEKVAFECYNNFNMIREKCFLGIRELTLIR